MDCNHNEVWTNNVMVELCTLRSKGKPFKLISKKLGRKETATYNRYCIIKNIR